MLQQLLVARVYVCVVTHYMWLQKYDKHKRISFLYKPLHIFKCRKDQIQVLPFLAKIIPIKGIYFESMSEKIMFAHPQSTSLLALTLTDLFIFIWGSTYGMDRNVETKYTFCQRPFSWNLSCILQQEGVTTQDKKLQILRAENFNIQFKLLSKNQ